MRDASKILDEMVVSIWEMRPLVEGANHDEIQEILDMLMDDIRELDKHLGNIQNVTT